MKMTVVVNLQKELLHCWPGCPHDDVNFLINKHRHVFHIKCQKAVTHSDRQVEIIRLKREIEGHLDGRYPDGDAGTASCEDLARELVAVFDLESCEVLEDGENGARVEV